MASLMWLGWMASLWASIPQAAVLCNRKTHKLLLNQKHTTDLQCIKYGNKPLWNGPIFYFFFLRIHIVGATHYIREKKAINKLKRIFTWTLLKRPKEHHIISPFKSFTYCCSMLQLKRAENVQPEMKGSYKSYCNNHRKLFLKHFRLLLWCEGVGEILNKHLKWKANWHQNISSVE